MEYAHNTASVCELYAAMKASRPVPEPVLVSVMLDRGKKPPSNTFALALCSNVPHTNTTACV